MMLLYTVFSSFYLKEYSFRFLKCCQLLHVKRERKEKKMLTFVKCELKFDRKVDIGHHIIKMIHIVYFNVLNEDVISKAPFR